MPPAMSTPAAIIFSMRPRQWTKNLIVFAPALFGGVLLESGVALRLVAAFCLMCALSGAVYLLNDLHDTAADRVYERTRERPLAAGTLSPRVAGITAAVLLIGSCAAGVALEATFGLMLVGYAALQVAYTVWLKHVAVVEVLAISAGFVLRALAGARVANVPDSPWLLVCAALLVGFLAFAKRRQELADLGPTAPRHRPVLAHYPLAALDVLLAALLGATIVSYLAYALVSNAAHTHPLMVLTAPFVTFGLFRYLTLVYADEPCASAEDVLLTDPGILASVSLWLVAVSAIVYVV